MRSEAMRDPVRLGQFVYKVGAISNFAVTIPAFIVYDWYVEQFTNLPPRYPFLVWIWSGMAFLWGVMFWEISTDIVGKYSLIKYSYLEKAITSTSVIVAFAIGDIPGRFLAGVVATDIVWIPLFAFIHLKISLLNRSRAPGVRSAEG